MACIDLWSDKQAAKIVEQYCSESINEDLSLRTYSARLLGQDPELVLHGGGNTSVKSQVKDLVGVDTSVMFIKGSGWDLATIEPAGHPGVRLEPLRRLKSLKALSDEAMVATQRINLINPNSPNPSVEALLHAFLPHKFVDHTHSVALLALADQENAEEICREIYGNKVIIIPYVMPGFQLALEASNAYEKAIRNTNIIDSEIEGMILLKHGIFSFGETAKESYKRMIKLVNQAERVLPRKISLSLCKSSHRVKSTKNLYQAIAYLRGLLCKEDCRQSTDNRWVFDIRVNKDILDLVNSSNLKELSQRGVVTPDHVIRTKAKPWVVDKLPDRLENDQDNLSMNKWLSTAQKSLEEYKKEYINYFTRYNIDTGEQKKQLDPLPRLILFPGVGMIGIGRTKKSAQVTADIGEAWVATILAAEALGAYKPVTEKETFEMEYWSLEQAKLGKMKKLKFDGQVVMITGAGGAIGAAIAKEFSSLGAEIIAIDKNINAAQKTAEACGSNSLVIGCDLTNREEVRKAFEDTLVHFGGLDIVISNAGAASSGRIADLDDSILKRSIELNLMSHQYVAKQAVQIFKAQDKANNSNLVQIGGQILFNISKQALNPGQNFGAYGIAKAGLLALMKQYALEEGQAKIRSNGINADRIRSGLLNDEMIASRAHARGVSQDEYMSGNLLNSEVKAIDVAKAFVALASMDKTTGALLTVDGGNVSAMVR